MAVQAASSLKDDGIAAPLLLAQVCLESRLQVPATSAMVLSCEGSLKTSEVRLAMAGFSLCSGTAAQVTNKLCQIAPSGAAATLSLQVW